MKMNRVFAGIVVLSAVSAGAASANVLVGSCSEGTSADSFGRGIEEAVLENSAALPTKYADAYCYQIGMKYAHEQMASYEDGSDFCVEDFKDGRTEGLQAGTVNGGNACYALGYKAGQADLEIGARDGDASVVGQTCVDLYDQGAQDYQAGRAMTKPGSASNAKLATCYSEGYIDGSLPAAK